MMNIRNFCIIAHIDHGKSTLADRFLELTGTIPKEKMQPQYLDLLSVERKHGVTVKMQPVRFIFNNYIFNLIDTPGHSDFSYEVSRALKAVEGAVLLVDSTQGIQAQTLFHLEEAKKQKKVIIPVINKIDLQWPSKELQDSIKNLTGSKPLLVSAKTGEGIEELLKTIIEKVPPPPKITSNKLALVFDSHYENYRGVIFHVRILGEDIKNQDTLFISSLSEPLKVIEVGYFTPFLQKQESLKSGEIGYIITNLKKVNIYVIGEVMTNSPQLKNNPEIKPYFEFKQPQRFIFASFFPATENAFSKFKDVIEKICLNDPAVSYEEIYFKNFGRGFKLGFLGLFHLEIIKERIEEEFQTEVVITFPLINYKVLLKNGKEILVNEKLPPENEIEATFEPWIEGTLLTPPQYNLFDLIKEKRGNILNQNLIDDKLEIKFEMPLEEILTNFYDQVKAKSSGYASFWWEFKDYREKKIGELNIFINGTKAFGFLVVDNKAFSLGKKIVEKLKELLPRQTYETKIQAIFRNKIIASAKIPALIKNPAEWLYGGDRSRKIKLWQKQKEGQKKLKELSKGRNKISSDVIIKLFKEL